MDFVTLFNLAGFSVPNCQQHLKNVLIPTVPVGLHKDFFTNTLSSFVTASTVIVRLFITSQLFDDRKHLQTRRGFLSMHKYFCTAPSQTLDNSLPAPQDHRGGVNGTIDRCVCDTEFHSRYRSLNVLGSNH